MFNPDDLIVIQLRRLDQFDAYIITHVIKNIKGFIRYIINPDYLDVIQLRRLIEYVFYKRI